MLPFWAFASRGDASLNSGRFGVVDRGLEVENKLKSIVLVVASVHKARQSLGQCKKYHNLRHRRSRNTQPSNGRVSV